MIKFNNENMLILIVDDTPKNLQVLGSLLSTEKYRVAFAKSGKDALEFAVKQPPNLILLDIMMPNMDGFEVCKRLKADQKTMDIPIIFLTSLNDDFNEEKGLSLGAVDYITKPFRPIPVKARVKSSLKLSCSYNEIKRQKLELEKSIEQLKASEDKLRAIIETSPDGICIMSLDGLMQYVSPAMLVMWGYEHESDMIGKKITDLVSKNSHEAAASSMQEKLNGKFTGAKEYVMVRKDGSEFVGESNSSVLYNEKNEPVSFLIVSRDITSRKNAEEALRESEAKYRTIIEHSGDAIAIRQNGKFEFANRAFSKMLDYSTIELVEIENSLIFDSDILNDMEKRLSKNDLNENPSTQFETRITTKDKTKIDVSIFEKIISYKEEKAQLVIVRDITKQKAIMKVLQRGAEQTKGLNEFIPICAGCSKIRDDEKENKPWVKPSDYITGRLPDILFSHCMCPDCMNKWYPETDSYDK
jgi:PAS domain S-box-containing protein